MPPSYPKGVGAGYVRYPHLTFRAWRDCMAASASPSLEHSSSRTPEPLKARRFPQHWAFRISSLMGSEAHPQQ